MTALVFVDTNVLIYARDRKETGKRLVAQNWLDALAETRRLVINLQVVNEFTRWLLLNNPSQPLGILKGEVDLLGDYGGATPLDVDDVDLAWDVRDKLGYQWFDCLLLASAANAECSHFLSEDMGHETRYGSLTIINPFRVDPDAFLSKN